MAGAVERFRVYANYVRAFAELAGFPSFALGNPRLEHLAQRITANAVAAAGQPPDLPQVRASLINAWGTEMILSVTMLYAQEDELVGLTNNWAAVQLYYALYHGTQALIVARGYQRPDSHPTTQRMFADLWVTRPVTLAPWSLGMGPDGAMNGPGRDLELGIHPWTLCDSDTCWDLAGKALLTTRSHRLQAAIARRRVEKQRELRSQLEARGNLRAVDRVALPRLTAEEKLAINRRVRPFTMLDFLYRLRITTNYEDASVFIDGPETPAQARLVRRDLAYLASASLLLNEIHVGLAIGPERVRAWADTWLARNHPGGRPLGLARRRPYL